MKKSFYLCLTFVLFVALSSCDKAPTTMDNKNPLKNLLGSLLLDEDDAQMVFYTTSTIDKSQFHLREDSNAVYVYAYITDGFDFINPSSVMANNISLFNMDGYEGQFMELVEPFPVGPPHQIHWNIIGWSGINYQGIQEISNPLDFITPNYLDTVSATMGLTISYTGAAFSDSIRVSIRPASAENFGFFGMTSSPSHNRIDLTVFDNGLITIPSHLLSGLYKEIYYDVTINNYKLDSEVYEGRKILKKSMFVSNTAIYLVQ